MDDDLLKKVRTAQSPDDLVTLAEKSGFKLSKSDAEHYFNAVKSREKSPMTNSTLFPAGHVTRRKDFYRRRVATNAHISRKIPGLVESMEHVTAVSIGRLHVPPRFIYWECLLHALIQ